MPGQDKIFVNGAWVPLGLGGTGGEPPLGNPAVDDYILSSTTAGVRSWVAQSGGSFDTNAYYTLSADQAVTTGANRKILFDTVIFDGNTEWDVANAWWECKTTGYYFIDISAAALGTYTGTFRTLLYVDGVYSTMGTRVTGVSGYTTTSQLIIPNFYVAAGSYLEAYCIVTVNTSVENATSSTWLRITRYK